MKVKDLITELQKCDQDAEVKMHHYTGNNALFVCEATNINGKVWIEDRGDIDLRAEIDARIENCGPINETFFKALKKIGVTLRDIETYYPEIYDDAKKYYKN